MTANTIRVYIKRKYSKKKVADIVNTIAKENKAFVYMCWPNKYIDGGSNRIKVNREIDILTQANRELIEERDSAASRKKIMWVEYRLGRIRRLQGLREKGIRPVPIMFVLEIKAPRLEYLVRISQKMYLYPEVYDSEPHFKHEMIPMQPR